MNEKERLELEYYRQQYGQSAPDQTTPNMQAFSGRYGPTPAQDALSDEEQMAFWPDELDYDPKYKIAERYRTVHGSWPKKES